MVLEAWIQRMGNNVSNNLKKTALLSLDLKRRKSRAQNFAAKPLIGILSFEVASIMSKSVQLWQSLSELEVHRLRTEVVTSPGIKYLVSDDEDYLLALACAEKVEDLDNLAAAVSRLGKKCNEPALLGFEHVYSDLLCGNIDFRDLEFLIKDIDASVKKMERYIAATSNLYQELEVLTDLEHSARKLQRQGNNDGSLSGSNGNFSGSIGGGSFSALQQKILWKKQGIKRLRDVSLWNQSYDKVVGILARMVCTIYGRVCSVFGSSAILGSLPAELRDHFSAQLYSNEDGYDEIRRSAVVSGSVEPYGRSSPLDRLDNREIRFASGPLERQRVETVDFGYKSGPILSRLGSRKAYQNRERGVRTETSTISANWSSSPGRLFKECLSLNGNSSPKHRKSQAEKRVASMVSNSKPWEGFGEYRNHGSSTVSRSGNGLSPDSRILPPSGPLQPQRHSGPVYPVPRNSGGLSPLVLSGPIYNKQQHTRSQFGSKFKLVHAPPSTLGGAALALHYANVIILVEKLVRFPHLVGHDARDDLYQMLPMSVRMALRSRLKSYAKNLASTIYDAPLAADWKEALETILGWLGPLAHNMIRWQSEHNFEQQKAVSKTNVLLLQTLYFADQSKTEATITELLVGLNYICRYEQEIRASGLMDCSSQDYDEYLEWHL
ncbi:hypothetical protein SUGI_0859680 [Cryptomeria japonica]|uniref:uncharacterized protein LOC131067094 n=1 Tax=Cryptomeria japonica TaxID=3369 RepID=UPI002414C8CB|nr:uncharacterized protein LOC131067094 [Cryptomeria japonica]GLJ41538.1 hypothetical protein SUGI_0859680 [Cryptomeria japonica]